MADFSGAREQQMSEELISATRRQKKSSNPTASHSKSDKNEIRICCPTPGTIYLSGISEPGKSIAEPSERAQAASTAESTALRSGGGPNLPFDRSTRRQGNGGNHWRSSRRLVLVAAVVVVAALGESRLESAEKGMALKGHFIDWSFGDPRC